MAMPKEIICRLKKRLDGRIEINNYELDDKGKIKKEIHTFDRLTLQETIANDKQFGLLKPQNGESYGYIILNGDIELTGRDVRKMMTRGLLRWSLELDFKFHRVRNVFDADLIFEFRDERNDPLLDSSTIAYMYYPLGGVNDGLCVINTRPYFTLHGNGIDMHYIDPIHYPRLNSGVKGSTIDGDQVIGHEAGHGLLGLPHTPPPFVADTLMAPNYSLMSEHPSDFDIMRGAAKIPRRSTLSRKYKRLKEWFLHTSDR